MTTNKVITLVRQGDAALSRLGDEEVLLKEALASLDSLREALLAGRIKAFFAVGLTPDHTTLGWSGKRASTTLLEMYGAWHSMAANISGFES